MVPQYLACSTSMSIHITQDPQLFSLHEVTFSISLQDRYDKNTFWHFLELFGGRSYNLCKPLPCSERIPSFMKI